MPLVVSGGFMAARILAVILGGVGSANSSAASAVCDRSGGPSAPGGGALMPALAFGALVVPLVVVGHPGEPSSRSAGGAPARTDC